MENNHFDLNAKRRMLYKRKKIRRLLKLFLTSFFSLMIVLGIASSYIKNNTNITTLNKNALKNKISSTQENKDNFKVCIDPGHGDEDIGAKGINGSYEKDLVLNIALELGKILKEKDIDVVYTRIDDNLPWSQSANDSLKERLKVSKISNVDVFISIHCNSDYTATDAKGVETWYKNGDDASYTFASYLQYELGQLDYTYNRGLKTYESKDDALAVLELNENTAALVELGFLSNSQDEKYLTSNVGQKNCAEALSKAILDYKKNVLANKK
ncbi:N-acetylmuramoyl-L-alanine amidase family protein [Clostridium sp. 29_15]|uniref:N-acetylmuramoyl-L-alanine amidase family protein n=1 Tax=Clostridium sp. 29_15 TaxID=1896982 RepID=UPI000964B707|nr:N-acetylmuramoyl-L-alanine amidase [Clostridium sp. 29_15]OKZ88237.1 MAG: N-acetylmuramoyl-L-alanine amidase [Clostridium sp. 29_15]